MEKWVAAQTDSRTYDSFNPESVARVLKRFISACENNGVDEDAALSLFYFFMHKSLSALFNASIRKTADWL